MEPLSLSLPRNPRDTHQSVIETVLELAKKAKNIIVIVDA